MTDIERAIESARCRIYKLKAGDSLTYNHQVKAENQVKLMEVTVSALEKQIPKKPLIKSGESVMAIDYAGGHGEIKKSRWQDWVCPVCGWFVGKRFNADQRKPHDQRKSYYCNECGQAIDWSEEE